MVITSTLLRSLSAVDKDSNTNKMNSEKQLHQRGTIEATIDQTMENEDLISQLNFENVIYSKIPLHIL